ncbi:LamG domain-containing protein, partial [Acidianus sp. RZ1]|uniref:LamG domain-containing protein n=1 Tax=Acidianus sp. RZ1 TaxID=1540082 RepID=UPI001492DE43
MPNKRISRRDFLRYAITSAALSGVPIAIKVNSGDGNTRSTSLNQQNGSSGIPGSQPYVFPYIAVVYQEGNTYTAIVGDDNVIFQGKCSDGSGTCGIYEAMSYLSNSYGQGALRLLGNFYPTGDPQNVPENIYLTGDAIIYMNAQSARFFINLLSTNQSLDGISYSWYKNPGKINSILQRRVSFSLDPYVIFMRTSDSLIFSNGSLALGSPNSFTISAWVNGRPNPYGGHVLSYGSLNPKNLIWSLQIPGYNENYVSFSGIGSVSSPLPSSSQPMHLAVVYSGGIATLYVNGKEVSSGSVKINYSSPAYLWINNFPLNSQQAGINLNGWSSWIENVQFYNTNLSPSQISQLSSSPTVDPVDYSSLTFWGLYRYIVFLGDLVTGIGFQRMGGILLSGVI